MKVKTISQIMFLAVAVSLSTGNTYSQDDSVKANNSLKDGAWALQFQISDNFTLRSFQGATISVKKHCTNRSAVRVGISGEFSFSAATNFYSDTSFASETEAGGSNNLSYSIVGQYLFYPNPTASFNFFFGCGPTLSLTRSNYTANVSESLDRVEKTNRWGLGVAGAVGVEWFVLNELSFHTEYGAAIRHTWYEQSSETRLIENERVVSKNGRRVKTWDFVSNGVKFGLSVYF
jgi:hypothetical protein